MSHIHYHNIQSSLLRFCADFAEEHDLVAINLDAHTDEVHWPDQDFIGLSEFRVDIMETYSGACMFGISTKEDTNLFRMGALVKQLSALVLPNKCITAYDADTGEEIGLIFILQGTRIGAPIPTKTQPILPIGIRFETDLKSFG